MKNKQGNVAVIALIVVIVAITASVITWLVATRTPAPQPIATQPTVPVVQSQPVAQQPTAVTSQPVASDKFAGWQTYTDAQHGFEFKYPVGFVVTKVDANNIIMETIAQSRSKSSEPVYMRVGYDDDFDGKLGKIVFQKIEGVTEDIPFAGGTASASDGYPDRGNFSSSYDIAIEKGTTIFSVHFLNKIKSTLTDNDKMILASFKLTK